MTTLDIRLKKVSKIYHEGDLPHQASHHWSGRGHRTSLYWEDVVGVVVVESRSEVKHEGLMLFLDGTVNMQLSAKNVGIFEAFYSSAKPTQLINYSVEIAKPGKLPAGRTELPFEFPLRTRGNKVLYETYHGVFVNIQYLLKCELKRSFLNKDMQKTVEFIVEYKEGAEKAVPAPVSISISPNSLQNMRDRSKVPDFVIKGRIDSTCCCITQPFTGMLSVERCDTPIRSMELQLARVETCGCAEGYARDATEIQNIQIGEGDVCHGISIPIYMVFPRLFTCPTLVTNNFKIEFEVNIVVVFEDDHLMSENYPIKLTRF